MEASGSTADVPRRSLGQMVRFGIVGVVNTLIDFGVFSALRLARVALVPANVVAASAAMSFSFLVNRRFVFRGDNLPWQRQVVLFLLGTAFSMFVLQNVVIVALQRIVPVPVEAVAAVRRSLDLEPAAATTLVRSVVAKGGAVAVTLVWNFSFYRFIVFAPAKVREGS